MLCKMPPSLSMRKALGVLGAAMLLAGGEGYAGFRTSGPDT